MINSNGKIIISDGAFGTYYSQLTGKGPEGCELDNIANPALISRIHREYIDAGAALIRTNTFAANTFALQVSREKTAEVIKAGWRAALNAAPKDTLIFASIGPVAAENGEDVFDEYRFIADCFLDCGTVNFLFETFADTAHLPQIAAYIKSKKPDAFVIASFAFSADGYTRNGTGLPRVIGDLQDVPYIDMLGFNCGSGPAHLIKLLKNAGSISKPFSVMPNAGYAGTVHERTVFTSTPDYFGRVTADFAALGASVIGGCCGTTPAHIRALAYYLKNPPAASMAPYIPDKTIPVRKKALNLFAEKLKSGRFVTAVELDPPYAPSAELIIKNARRIMDAGADIITVADSPLSRPCIDSVALASKIRREAGMDAMPHICCRDRNINALKSTVLAAYMEGIRNVLAVTGDPIPESDRGYVKGVFNVGSLGLIELLNRLNGELFAGDELYIGGALNINANNMASEMERAKRKLDNGAGFFLTQPVFSPENLSMLSPLRKRGAKVLAGIIPIVSYRNAVFLNNEIPGISIPQEYIDCFHPEMPRQMAVERGLDIAYDIASKIRGMVDGFYLITPFNRADIICSLIGRLKAGGLL